MEPKTIRRFAGLFKDKTHMMIYMDYLSQIEQLRNYNAALKIRMEHIKERLKRISGKMDQACLPKNYCGKQ